MNNDIYERISPKVAYNESRDSSSFSDWLKLVGLGGGTRDIEQVKRVADFSAVQTQERRAAYLDDPLAVLPGVVVLCVLTENVCDELQLL